MNENAFWVSIVTAVIGLATTIFTGIMAFRLAQLKQSGELALLASREVAFTLEATNRDTREHLIDIKETGVKTLKHVNDSFLIQLRLYKESMAVIAHHRNAPGDKEKAEAAERMYEDHAAKQKESESLSQKESAAAAKALKTDAAEIKEAISGVSESIRAAALAATGKSVAEPDLTPEQKNRIAQIKNEAKA